GQRCSRLEPASPPRPIPPSTVANTRLSAIVSTTTNIDRKRSQMTSRAMRLPPARKAHASNRQAATGDTDPAGGPAALAETVSFRPRDIESAAAAATIASRLAIHALRV